MGKKRESAQRSDAVNESKPGDQIKDRYTYQDYLQLPEEPGFRFEVLDGCLIKEPSPAVHHQRVKRRLQLILHTYFTAADPDGELFDAPLDVTLSDYTVVQPDILFIPSARRSILAETRVDGSPELVVEILSPSSRAKDRTKKMEVYRKAGIPHYWIVDPEEGTLEAFRLKEGAYQLTAVAGDGETFIHPDFPGLEICIQDVCRRPDLDEAVRALAQSSGATQESDTIEESRRSYPIKDRYTYQDYLQLPEEPGFRFEVLDGCLIKEPSPTVHHQRVNRRLQRILEDYFTAADPDGEMFYAPLDVTLSDYTVVQPDILYIPGVRRSILAETRVDGSPELVVEVLSPSNHAKDRIKKMEVYRKAGIPHYWIVDPEEGTLEAFSLKEGTYQLTAAAGDSETFTHPDFPGLEICMKDVCQHPGS